MPGSSRTAKKFEGPSQTTHHPSKAPTRYPDFRQGRRALSKEREVSIFEAEIAGSGTYLTESRSSFVLNPLSPCTLRSPFFVARKIPSASASSPS
jgi:hypothetical protein